MKNYFASFIPAVKAILGIEAWSKDADKKDALLEEQKQQRYKMSHCFLAIPKSR